jgi:hypothetical protein
MDQRIKGHNVYHTRAKNRSKTDAREKSSKRFKDYFLNKNSPRMKITIENICIFISFFFSNYHAWKIQ